MSEDEKERIRAMLGTIDAHYSRRGAVEEERKPPQFCATTAIITASAVSILFLLAIVIFTLRGPAG